ncbi:peptidoglycan-binding domain-containing protein [Streptacidiphilus sp. PAMC 29251]
MPTERRRPSSAVLALLALGATAAAITTLVEATGPSVGRPSPQAPVATVPASVAPSTASSSIGVAVQVSAPATPRKTATAAPVARPKPVVFAPREPTVLGPGDRGPAVAELQRRLFAQGFTYVAITGVYDRATVRGVTQLQQNWGITGDPTGVYGAHSQAALGANP